MKDEEYLFFADCREKKTIARSARNARTHCGKGGRVRLPSDNMTKKELKAMNGKCETYRLNQPMTWEEFKRMPDEHKVTYIKLLRQKWNVPDSRLAEMLGVHKVTFCRWTNTLGVNIGQKRSGCEKWDEEGFMAWVHGVPAKQAVVDTPVEDVEKVEPVAEAKEKASLEDIAHYEPVSEEPVAPVTDVLPVTEEKVVRHAIPSNGSMTFEGNIEDILNTLGMLLKGAKVHIGIQWDVMEEVHG